MLEKLKIRCPNLETVSYTRLPLPFKSKQFDAIACNDVIHHIQEVSDLFLFNNELNRILKPRGFLLISDRRPTRYVNGLLVINSFFRKIFLKLNPSKMTLGSEVELPMDRSYYDALFADYDIVQRIKWRSTLSSLLIGLSFFLNLILPASWIRCTILPVVSWLEKILYPANRLFAGAAKKMRNDNFLTAFANDGFVKLPTRKKQSYLKLIEDCFAQSLALADVTRNKSTKLEKKWTHATGHVKHVVNPHREYNNFRRLILDEHICSAIKKIFSKQVCLHDTQQDQF